MKLLVIIIIIGMFAYLAAVVAGYYFTDLRNQPVLMQETKDGNVEYLYNFYVAAIPNTKERLYIGSPDAVITMTAYIDFTSGTSKQYMEDIFPFVKENYIDKGKLRYYHKNYLTQDDLDTGSARYMYAKSLSCFQSYDSEWLDFYQELFNAEISQVFDLAESHGVSKDDMNTCLQISQVDTMLEDASEVRKFGMSLTQGFI